MYCTKCGKKVEQNEAVCPQCSAKILRPEVKKAENLALAIFALIFSICCPAVGFLLGMVGVSVYTSPKLRNLSARAITISATIFIILCVATIFVFSII